MRWLSPVMNSLKILNMYTTLLLFMRRKLWGLWLFHWKIGPEACGNLRLSGFLALWCFLWKKWTVYYTCSFYAKKLLRALAVSACLNCIPLITEGFGCFSLFHDVPCLQNSPVQLFIWLFSVCLMVLFGDLEPLILWSLWQYHWYGYFLACLLVILWPVFSCPMMFFWNL